MCSDHCDVVACTHVDGQMSRKNDCMKGKRLCGGLPTDGGHIPSEAAAAAGENSGRRACRHTPGVRFTRSLKIFMKSKGLA